MFLKSNYLQTVVIILIYISEIFAKKFIERIILNVALSSYPEN